MSTPEGDEDWKDSVEVVDTKKVSLHQSVSFLESFIVLTLLLVNVILFALANALVGAEEYITLGIGNTTSTSFKVYDFGLESSFVLMNDAGAHGIAYLILLLSSVWPYVKTILLVCMWLIPVTRTTREWTLWGIDLLGKWSLLDMFFIVILGLAFNIKGGPGDLYIALGLLCTDGVYLFVLAAILSLSITQYAVSVHHRVMYGKNGLKSKMGRVCLENQYVGKYIYFVLAAFLSAVSLWLFIWGASIPFFSFEYSGALTELITGTSNTTYTMANLGSSFPEATFNQYGSGPTFFSFLYYMFIFVAPISLSISIPVIWWCYVFDYDIKIRSSLLHWVQIVAAWAAPDVLVVALGAGTVQLNIVIQQSIIQASNQVHLFKYSGYQILENFCGSGSGTLLNMECLAVNTKLHDGFFLVVGSILVTYLMTIPTAILLSPKVHKHSPILEKQLDLEHN